MKCVYGEGVGEVKNYSFKCTYRLVVRSEVGVPGTQWYTRVGFRLRLGVEYLCMNVTTVVLQVAGVVLSASLEQRGYRLWVGRGVRMGG